MRIKRIGLLTSGGDAPGMNAAIRSVVRSANSNGIEVYGIRRGYNGLINDDMRLLKNKESEEFMSKEGKKKAYENCKKRELDALIAIGGDGTFTGLRDFSRLFKIPVIGIPATIDNDVGCTHYTIGFDTAANTAVEAIDRIKDTMQSHERCSVIEVMGHTSGKLALYVGIATGATTVLIPEEKWSFKEDIEEKIKNYRSLGYTHFLLIVAEGAKDNKEGIKIEGSVGAEIVKLLKERLHIDPRLTILGHIQRGGNPTVRDRVTATRMGYMAVKALIEGRKNKVIVHKEGAVRELDLEEALKMKSRLYKLEEATEEAMTQKAK